MKIAAVGDIHCTRTSQGQIAPIFTQAKALADVLVLCGDLTDYGLPEEADILVEEMRKAMPLTVIAVLGNHDYESGQAHDVRHILLNAGVKVLDGESYEYKGVGFAGVKGFGGGFDERVLQPWGEKLNKDFVQESVQESLKLGSALAKINAPVKVVLLHYSPIKATVVGEPIDIYPFVGTSRLEEPIDRHSATMVFHGHAHHGSPEGHTKKKIPVYNVAMPLLKHRFPDQPPLRIMKMPVHHGS